MEKQIHLQNIKPLCRKKFLYITVTEDNFSWLFATVNKDMVTAIVTENTINIIS